MIDPRVEPLAQALWLADEQRIRRLSRRRSWAATNELSQRIYRARAADILAWQPAGVVETHACPALTGRPLYGYLPRVQYLTGVRKTRPIYWLGPVQASLEAAIATVTLGDPERKEYAPWLDRDVIALVADEGSDVAVWAVRPDEDPIHLCAVTTVG